MFRLCDITVEDAVWWSRGQVQRPRPKKPLLERHPTSLERRPEWTYPLIVFVDDVDLGHAYAWLRSED